MGSVEKFIDTMESIALDNFHGYDQINRWGPNYDCSSLVITALESAGYPVRTKYGATYTGNLDVALEKIGCKKVNVADRKRGDILYKNGHVIAVSDYNHVVGARINENGKTRGGKTGDQTGREICIHNFYKSNWICYRLPECSPNKSSNIYKVNTARSRLMLRSEPNTESKILMRLVKGSLVEFTGITEYVDGLYWYKVSVGGMTGWACAKYLKRV